MNSNQKYVKGLFCGGTFCDEAIAQLKIIVGRVHSNTAGRDTLRLADSFIIKKHTVIDLGDEEFTLVFPDVELKKASYLAKSIQKAVDNLQIKHECSKAGSYVTVSIGAVSKIPNDSSSPTELISEADKNLYKAKAAGRNTFFIL